MTTIHRTFGTVLRQIRESKGMSLNKTAQGAGITPGYLSKLENGLRFNPSRETLWRLSLVLGVNYDTLARYAGYAYEEVDDIINDLQRLPEYSQAIGVLATLTPEQAKVASRLMLSLRGA